MDSSQPTALDLGYFLPLTKLEFEPTTLTPGGILLLKRGSGPLPRFEFDHRTAMSGISVAGKQEGRFDCADGLFGK